MAPHSSGYSFSLLIPLVCFIRDSPPEPSFLLQEEGTRNPSFFPFPDVM